MAASRRVNQGHLDVKRAYTGGRAGSGNRRPHLTAQNSRKADPAVVKLRRAVEKLSAAVRDLEVATRAATGG